MPARRIELEKSLIGTTDEIVPLHDAEILGQTLIGISNRRIRQRLLAPLPEVRPCAR
jgi:hypothetical protein